MCDRAVIVHRHRIIHHRTWSAFFRHDHLGECSILEDEPDADAIDNSSPARDKCIFLVLVSVLLTMVTPMRGNSSVATRDNQAENGRLDLFDLVDSTNLLEGVACHPFKAEEHRIDSGIDQKLSPGPRSTSDHWC